jgi:LysR family transcriptional regulator, glycine cleavage system transcriptional activator
MRRTLPPFAAVRAFEAAARHLSFKAAADELCLSPSAVSHQIRSLEKFLDTRLFEREAGRIRLTLTGEAYAGKLTVLLDGIDQTTRDARTSSGDTLRVLSTPGFAARWLVPRMNRFAHAGALRLRVSVGAPCTDFRNNDADVVIQWSDACEDGLSVEPLMQSGRYPVISPALRREKGIERPEDLAGITLMHDETMDRWAEWFAIAGVQPPAFPRGPTFPNCELATTAAEQGLGVSLAYDLMVRDTIAAGRLERLFDEITMPFVIYSVTVPEARRDEPLIAAFRGWLFSEVHADGRPFLTAAAAE